MPRRSAIAVAALLVTALLVAGCTGNEAAVPSRGSTGADPASSPTPSTASVLPGTSSPTSAPPGTSSPTATTTSSPPTPTDLPTAAACPCYTDQAPVTLGPQVPSEASGMTTSSVDAGVYFIVDDGGGTDGVDAVDRAGKLLSHIVVQDMSLRNAEALASGPCGDTAGTCLYIGDIGDNAESREDISIFRIAEPSVFPPSSRPVPADRWRYTYPDGPHNAEAMVLGPDGSPVVITKSAPDDAGHVPPHRIYRGAPGGGPLSPVAEFTPAEPLVKRQSLLTGTVVTDAAYRSGQLLLLTYDQVLLYTAPDPADPSTDPADFPDWSMQRLPVPDMIQTEGIAWDRTGCGYELASEAGPTGDRSSIAQVSCQP